MCTTLTDGTREISRGHLQSAICYLLSFENSRCEGISRYYFNRVVNRSAGGMSYLWYSFMVALDDVIKAVSYVIVFSSYVFSQPQHRLFFRGNERGSLVVGRSVVLMLLLNDVQAYH